MKKKKFPWLPLFALSFAYAAAFNAPYIRYYLYDSMLEAIGCTNTQLALLTSITMIVSVLNTIPGGWVADRFSAKQLISFSVLCNFPLTIIAAVFSQYYWVQVAVFCGYAFSTGFAFWPALLKGIRVVGGEDNQSTSFGIFESAQGLIATITVTISTAIFAIFADHVFGYKAALVTMGSFCLIAFFLVRIFYKDPEEAAASQGQPAPEKNKFEIKDTIQLLKNPGLWLVSLTVGSVYGLYICQSYLTPYFTGVLGATVVFTGFFAILRDSGTKVIGGPLGGLVAKKAGSSSLLISICLVVCGGLIFCISRIRGNGGSVMGLIMAVVLINAVICMMAKGTMWATMSEANIPMRLSGTAISIATIIGINLPDIVLPLVNGSLLDKYADDLPRAYGYYFTILITLALVGAAAALTIFLRDRKRRQAGKAQTAAE